MLPLLLAASLATAIASPRQTVSEAQLGESVQAGVRARLVAEGSSARVSIAGRLPAQMLPAGELRLELGEVAGRWPRARAALPVRILVDDRYVRSLTAWIELRDEREVPAYGQAYAAGTPGSDIGIAPAVVDMICCVGDPVSSPDVLAGQRLERSVRAGEPVLLADFEPLPDVHARSEVAIELERGAVRITTRGIALDDGAAGEPVPVRPAGSDTAIQARVLSEGTVRIDE